MCSSRYAKKVRRSFAIVHPIVESRLRVSRTSLVETVNKSALIQLFQEARIDKLLRLRRLRFWFCLRGLVDHPLDSLQGGVRLSLYYFLNEYFIGLFKRGQLFVVIQPHISCGNTHTFFFMRLRIMDPSHKALHELPDRLRISLQKGRTHRNTGPCVFDLLFDHVEHWIESLLFGHSRHW